MRKRNIIILIILILITSSILLGVLIPRYSYLKNTYNIDWEGEPLVEGSAAEFIISGDVITNFGIYKPKELEYTPNVPSIRIQPNLVNVDLQGILVERDIKRQLEMYGFALKETQYDGYDLDIVDGYPDYKGPFFVTTDVCLHLFHLLFDFSLQILEHYNFTSNLEEMLELLRSDQISIYNETLDANVLSATEKNIAYLTVILSLLDNTTIMPNFCEAMVIEELDNINNEQLAISSIFDYLENFFLYKVRGHYTKSEILSRYFKAMMYAGRMGFLLQESVQQTRMCLLLLNSFNFGDESEKINILWDSIYEPTVFYVGESDDLTIKEINQSWIDIGSPDVSQLGNDSIILDFIENISSYRKPTINSMLISSMDEFENKTQSFHLFGQRFVPDSYIFQELMHDRVFGRYLPSGLDIFSVLGSPRALKHIYDTNATYPEYNSQIHKLQTEFGNFNESAWTQNLYWLWIYTLLPLLKPASNSYPAFMQSDAWSDKALMTTMGSWTELRHDTILYTKYPWSLGWVPPDYFGYVEPYPEVYARLSCLTNYLIDGLISRQLIFPEFIERCYTLKNIYDDLTRISIKLLENNRLTDSENNLLINFGSYIAYVYDYQYEYYTISTERSALVADVAGTTTEAGSFVLEVAVGNPYIIYVVVPDHRGKLKLTYGATFSYYEFVQPAEYILNDDEWQEMLDTNSPALPEWISNSLPIVQTSSSTTIIYIRKIKH